jgi:hypothetical protein
VGRMAETEGGWGEEVTRGNQPVRVFRVLQVSIRSQEGPEN